MYSRILDRTSWLTAAGPTAFRRETKLSINSLEAISARKCWPPFLTHVSVSWDTVSAREASKMSVARR